MTYLSGQARLCSRDYFANFGRGHTLCWCLCSEWHWNPFHHLTWKKKIPEHPLLPWGNVFGTCESTSAICLRHTLSCTSAPVASTSLETDRGLWSERWKNNWRKQHVREINILNTHNRKGRRMSGESSTGKYPEFQSRPCVRCQIFRNVTRWELFRIWLGVRRGGVQFIQVLWGIDQVLRAKFHCTGTSLLIRKRKAK